MGHEGFLAGIGGWTGDLKQKGTWLAPATGTPRNRPINDLLDWLNANVATERGKRLQAVYDGPKDYGRRVFEADAAIIVIGIAQRDEIARLRQREQCGSWFFASANTSHNARKFCNDSCGPFTRCRHHFHTRIQ